MPIYQIGIDLMGADVPPSHIIEAALSLPDDFFHDVHLVLFGTQEHSITHPHITFRVCPEVVGMDDSPTSIIREKKASSLLIGVQWLKNTKYSAFLTLANTGALIAAVRSELECLPGISRPALACSIATPKGDVVMTDVGGNVETSAETLVQFARLGSAYYQTVYGIKNPKVALLNIGQEAFKGTQELKGASALLQEEPGIEFVGNKEPYDVFTKQADVFVTNGFSGNLFLKSCEAYGRHIFNVLKAQYPQIQPSDIIQEAGAEILGINKLVVKCHGAATKTAITNALLKQRLRIKALNC
ncbi:MAG: hypothetical protein LLF94_08475 [Chlamydiales bacterium]|nr:hypothetical protein [Chlamydiales bacterium]